MLSRERICSAEISAAAARSGTVLDNLAVGRTDVGHHEARAALTRVGLLDGLREVPGGLDAVLSVTGGPLSPDQQAQLLVARAIAGKPRLVVVDDFFDSLAPAVRDACVKAVTELSGCTVLAVCSGASSALAKRCTVVNRSDA